MSENLFERLREWNRRRVTAKRLECMRRNDLSEPRGLADPGTSARRILIIDAQGGLGDAIYVNGLATALAKTGRSVTAAALTRTLPVYEGNAALAGVFAIDTPEGLERIAESEYDLVLDASYVNLDRWPIRLEVLKRVRAYTVSCSLAAKGMNAVDRVIDLSPAVHVSERTALIYRSITGEDVPECRIPPQFANGADRIGASPGSLPSVYVNAMAGEPDRMLNHAQIAALAAWFAETKRFVGLFYVGEETMLPDSPFVVRLPAEGTLAEAADRIRRAAAVVTPDTSVTHFASACSIPSVVLFCAGETDYFGHSAMSDVWAPLAPRSLILTADDRPLTGNKKRIAPVSAVAPERVVGALIRVLQNPA